MTLRQSRLFFAFASGLTLLLAFCCTLALSQPIPPQPGGQISEQIPDVERGEAEAWLVTFGPGEIYWERFGHNAIWLREPAAGLDHTFNFGFFDFEQEDFFLRFLRGKMMYFSIAQPAAQEFQLYQQQNRSIRVQKLVLAPAEYARLRDYLLTEIKPENRN